MDNKYQLSNLSFQRIRVIIVDDHKLVAEGIELLINESDIAGVIGKAYSVAGCRELLAKIEADVLLLDINLPDGKGLELFPFLKTHYPNLKIIVLTSHYDMTAIKQALDIGASGYILKNAPGEEIIEGIQTVVSGDQFLCEEVNKLLKERDYSTVILTRREQELLRLLVDGKSTQEIADILFLGFETIKTYRKHLLFKMNVNNTAQLVKIAVDQHLV
jgi:DNA-binding NarL/FixJ family response regulator